MLAFLFAEASEVEYYTKLLGLPIAVVTLTYGTLTVMKLWRERKRSLHDSCVGRWEWDLEKQVLEVCLKPDGSWEGRVMANKGMLGSFFKMFSSGRVSGSWWIVERDGTLNIRDASGKWHIEDRIVKVKKDRVTLAAHGELVRLLGNTLSEDKPAAAPAS